MGEGKVPVAVLDSRIRVLRVIARMNVGGPAHHVSLLSGLLRPTRYRTRLIAGRVGANEASFDDLAYRYGAELRLVPALGPAISPLNDLSALFTLVGEVHRFQPDIVHTHTAKAGLLGRMAALIAGNPRPVVVHTYHGHVLEGYFGVVGNRLFRAAEKLLGRVSDRLVGVSDATVADLVRLGVAARERFAVIPLGLNLDRFLAVERADGQYVRDALGAAPDTFLAVVVGRLVPIKRVDLALRALARLRLDGVPAMLAVVGDGELRKELTELAVNLGLTDAVHFLGYRSDIAEIMAASDVALLTSDNEGTPVSLIEAAAAARPAVATAVGGVSEVVSPNTGELAPAGDHLGLAAGLALLANDPALRRERGALAREHVRSRYSAKRLLADIDNLYDELIREAAGGRRSHRLLTRSR